LNKKQLDDLQLYLAGLYFLEYRVQQKGPRDRDGFYIIGEILTNELLTHVQERTGAKLVNIKPWNDVHVKAFFEEVK